MTKPTLFDVDTDDGPAWQRWDKTFQPAPAEKATEGAPGSKQKLRAMIQRINSGQELFHPLDLSDGKYE